MNFLHQGFQKLSSDRQTRPKLYTTPLRGWSKTHKVDISEDGRPSLADRRVAVVCDESIDVVEVRSIVPQIVLMSVCRPQDAEMLHFTTNP